MEQCFSYTEKTQSKITFSSVHWSLMASGCLCRQHRAAGLCAPLSCCGRRTSPPAPQSLKNKLGPCLGAFGARVSRTKEHTLSLNREKIFSLQAGSPAQAVWALHLLVRMCFRPQACSYNWVEVERCAEICLSQHNFLIPFKPDWSWSFISIL